jgi:L-lactate utilization protein LutB
VVLCGIDKLVPHIHDAMRIVRVLPRNATAQQITAYVSWMSGAADRAPAGDGKKITHVVFLDNGRSAIAKDPLCRAALRCVRCGACANVCPVYRLVGGHRMGHVYIGAIGLILTYFFHGHENARNLVRNCINCEACRDVCAAGIDLPGIIQEIRARLNEETGSPLESSLLASVLANRKLFHTLLRFGKWAQRPVTGGAPFIRHLPEVFLRSHGFRALPAIAEKSFRDEWQDLRAALPRKGGLRIALFAGCAQDFLYPEQLRAAVRIFAAGNHPVDFPL